MKTDCLEGMIKKPQIAINSLLSLKSNNNYQNINSTYKTGYKTEKGQDSAQKQSQEQAQVIIQIHNQAVNKTLDYVENNLIQTQIRTGSSSSIDSTVQLHKAQKALFAVFRHDTSRNLDPQLHSHAIVINITQRNKEPKFRSTELKKIFENKMLLGAIYRSQLANQLIKKGYQIEQTHIDGRFEIKGFPQDLLDKFSTRRKDIEARLEELNKDDSKTSAKVALETRKAKVDVSRETLQKKWQEVISI